MVDHNTLNHLLIQNSLLLILFKVGLSGKMVLLNNLGTPCSDLLLTYPKITRMLND